MRVMIHADEFRHMAAGRTNRAEFDQAASQIVIARASPAAVDPSFDLDGAKGRTVPYVFSTDRVARDNHTVSIAGFDLNGFNSNPVFLWAHDNDEPPIGRVTGISRNSGTMKGVVEYMDADMSPFADMVFRMVKKRFLNAVSISGLPLEWKFSQDRNRPGGIDFIRQDLLEISQVPVPAQATALATARAAGIDTTPLVRWAERILDCGNNGTLRRDEVARLRTAAKTGEVVRRRRMAEALVLAGAWV
jgi:hypothetical protein